MLIFPPFDLSTHATGAQRGSSEVGTSIRAFSSTGIGCRWQARDQDASAEWSGFGISKAVQTTDVFVGVTN